MIGQDRYGLKQPTSLSSSPRGQEVLWCACGCLLVNRHGYCAQCNRRQRLSEENFGGLRERVLARDGWRCRACPSIENLLVHHRRPGTNAMALLITLCRTCHQRVHHTWRPAFSFDGLLRLLWREAHPGLAEQWALRLQLPPVIPDPPTVQTELFEAA